MKKTVSILLTLAMLLGILSCGFVLTSADSTNEPTKFFYDFSTQTSYDSYTNVKGGGKDFNSDNKALYVRSSNSGVTGPYVQIQEVSTKNTVGQVLAIKLKLTDVNSVMQSLKMNMMNSGTVTVDVSSVEYQKTTDWQLVLIDLSKVSNYTGSYAPSASYPWKTINELYFDAGKSPVESNAVYISWIGIFDNADNAKGYYDTQEQLASLRNPSFWDFTVQSNEICGTTGNDTFNANTANSAATYNNEYNAEYGAMKARWSNSNTQFPWMRLVAATKKTPMAEGQYLAIKMRTTDTAAVMRGFGTLADKDCTYTETGDTFSNGYSKYVGALPEYKKTTDWQLVLIELSADKLSPKHKALNGTWSGFYIEFDNAYTNNDAFYISWAGIFNSRDAAELYYAKTTDLKESELTALGAKRRVEDNALRFGFKITADGVGFEEGTQADAVAAGNYDAADLKSNSTMVINGVERQIVGFGAVLKMTSSDTFDANSLTVPAAEAANSNSLKVVESTRLYNVDGNDIEFMVTVTNAGKYPTYNYFSRAYVKYIGNGGEVAYAYSNVQVNSVNQVIEAENA